MAGHLIRLGKGFDAKEGKIKKKPVYFNASHKIKTEKKNKTNPTVRVVKKAPA